MYVLAVILYELVKYAYHILQAMSYNTYHTHIHLHLYILLVYTAGAPLTGFSGSGRGETADGFISFGIEKRNIEGNKKDIVINLLTSFHSYLYYHIKCTKTYLQMRMRKRVVGKGMCICMYIVFSVCLYRVYV